MTHQPQTYRYFLLTLDPVHVGTGGARLGRVDNPIVREPGTRLPKIPGSSLHGMIRSYAAHRYGKPPCSGQGQQEGRRHCGQPTCPICYTFGYARDRAGGRAGVVAISDARILLFPVYSMVGPVWVSTVDILQEAGFQVQQNGSNVSGAGLFATFERKQPLNLGWLMIEAPQQVTIGNQSQGNAWESFPEPIRNRVVLVSDKLFSQIVNSNLEVRTSVSINPETGAAEEGALFTYEAIPRATVLWMDVVVSDYGDGRPWKNGGVIWKAYKEEIEKDGKQVIQWHDNDHRAGPLYPDPQNPTQPQQINGKQRGWRSPQDVIQAGLEWAAHLGVGGMGTRGFGRIRVLNPHGDTENTEK